MRIWRNAAGVILGPDGVRATKVCLSDDQHVNSADRRPTGCGLVHGRAARLRPYGLTGEQRQLIGDLLPERRLPVARSSGHSEVYSYGDSERGPLVRPARAI